MNYHGFEVDQLWARALGLAMRDMRDHRSQEVVSASAGMSQQTWSHLESGRRAPNRRHVADIEQALGVEPGTLHTRAKEIIADAHRSAQANEL